MKQDTYSKPYPMTGFRASPQERQLLQKLRLDGDDILTVADVLRLALKEYASRRGVKVNLN